MKNKIIFAIFAIATLTTTSFCQQIETLFGGTKLSGLLQFHYINDRQDKINTFTLRRAEITLSGQIKPAILWLLRIDPAQVREDDIKKSGNNITSVGRKSPLQDFTITLKLRENLLLDFGQYKIPLGMEALESSSKLDFIERSLLSSKIKWADRRDIGVTLKCDQKLLGVKIIPAFGIFNGEGQNRLDTNDTKDLIGRLVAKPSESLHLGVAHYNGLNKIYSAGEIKFATEPFVVYGEYASGKENNTNKMTCYAAAGYKISNKIQLVARYDYCDEDTDKSGKITREFTSGVNYFIEKNNFKLQFNYVLRAEDLSTDDDALRVNLQIAY